MRLGDGPKPPSLQSLFYPSKRELIDPNWIEPIHRCMVDDILVFAATQEEHDQCLDAASSRSMMRALLLAKCEFNKRSIKFLRQVVESGQI